MRAQTRPLLSALVALGALGACDAGVLPLSIEIKDGAAAPGGNPDEIELLVKTIPGAEIHFEGQTRNTGDKANESFVVSKSKLKLGKNVFTVDATASALFSKKAATATGTYDAQARDVLRFESSAP